MLDKVENINGCWFWRGSIRKDGYGRIRREGRTLLAHRVFYRELVGELGSLQVLHKCDNKACVNPSHLYLGTISDNRKDCVRRGRDHNAGKTHCIHGHQLSKENVYLHNGSRHCRKCRSEADRRRKYARQH